MSLLDKAFRIQKKKRNKITISDEELELALAWARKEINNREAEVAINGTKWGGARIYVFMAHAFREYISRKKR